MFIGPCIVVITEE